PWAIGCYHLLRRRWIGRFGAKPRLRGTGRESEWLGETVPGGVPDPTSQGPLRRSVGGCEPATAGMSTVRRSSPVPSASGKHNPAPRQSRRLAVGAACQVGAILPAPRPDRIGG